MSITKEQWAEIEKQLSGMMGRVKLMCDGYEIDANIERCKMRLYVMVYVDGCFKGEWIANREGSEIPLKFYREQKRPAAGAKMRAWYLKESKSRFWSKEQRAEHAAKARKTFSTWIPYWPNAKAFCRHIRKTCTSIELVKIGY